jgi:hypothetical protein
MQRRSGKFVSVHFRIQGRPYGVALPVKLNRWGFIPRSLLRFRNGQSEVRHSRMF